MKRYIQPDATIWKGRNSDQELYFHEKIKLLDLNQEISLQKDKKHFGLLGYACDEGVRRNLGRVGAAQAPDSIRVNLASLANHFDSGTEILDTGTISCTDGDLEKTHQVTTNCISQLLQHNIFPIILGGGHDLAYPHFNGIKTKFQDATIGIINLDAHFDLRPLIDQSTSGTPFYQIAKENKEFNYLCLGIQKASNHKGLFDTAAELNVSYIENTAFHMKHLEKVEKTVRHFISSVDYIYLTIDIDGFSSAYAPGVSAPSPFGFSVDIALETITQICNSKKLVSVDLVELNPKYDIDHCTAKLAARLIYHIIQNLT